MLFCSDIHVLGSPLMNVVVTRMQEFATEFYRFSVGNTLDPHSGRGDPLLPHPPPAGPVTGCGAQAPNVGTQAWAPQLFNRGCAPWHRVRLLFSGWQACGKSADFRVSSAGHGRDRHAVVGQVLALPIQAFVHSHR